jgi:hypothetical protein
VRVPSVRPKVFDGAAPFQGMVCRSREVVLGKRHAGMAYVDPLAHRAGGDWVRVGATCAPTDLGLTRLAPRPRMRQ